MSKSGKPTDINIDFHTAGIAKNQAISIMGQKIVPSRDTQIPHNWM